jgi:hypothetical protein
MAMPNMMKVKRQATGWMMRTVDKLFLVELGTPKVL